MKVQDLLERWVSCQQVTETNQVWAIANCVRCTAQKLPRAVFLPEDQQYGPLRSEDVWAQETRCPVMLFRQARLLLQQLRPPGRRPPLIGSLSDRAIPLCQVACLASCRKISRHRFATMRVSENVIALHSIR